MNTLMQPLVNGSTEHDKAYALFEKLKDFYAQPLDGCWPLKPHWVPNLKKPPRHVKRRIGGGPIDAFRRFTFDEFVQILETKSKLRIERIKIFGIIR